MVYRVPRNANRRDYTLERQVGILIMNLMYYINETEFLEKSFFFEILRAMSRVLFCNYMR